MSLQLTYEQIRDHLGDHMGWGTSYADWSSFDDEVKRAERIIASGVRRFYNGSLKGETHTWSFLTPVDSLQMKAGEAVYDLPEGFVSIDRPFTFQDGSGQAVRLEPRAEGALEELRSNEDIEGRPEYYAIRSKPSSSGSGTKYEVLFYPKPDLAYSLSYRYRLIPPKLDENNDLHLGGAQHSETLLEAVLSSADSLIEDVERHHQPRFEELMANSIAIDRAVEKGGDDDIWDVDISPSIRVDFAYLQRVVGKHLDHGPNPGLWSRRQQEEVQLAIESGLRLAYFPLPLPEQGPHVWSFMRPTCPLELQEGEAVYTLPEDFNDLSSEVITFASPQENHQGTIARIGESAIRSLRAGGVSTGTPQYAAIRVKKEGAGYEMVFYPTPDTSTTVEMQYLRTPPPLSEENPIPVGTDQIGQLLIAACKYGADMDVKNLPESPSEAAYNKQLVQSIAYDAKLSNPIGEEVWDLDSVKSLSINKAYLKRLVGYHYDYGAHAALWTSGQRQKIETAVENGLKKFYNPVLMPNETRQHEWTFLRPLGSIHTLSNVYEYDLPDDFAMFFGPLTHAPQTGYLYPPIQVVGEEMIRKQHQYHQAFTRPTMAAIRPKRPDGDNVVGYQLLLWPSPDANYELQFRYQINSSGLADDTCVPCGGDPHAQTVLYACLAAGEELNGVVDGPFQALFMQHLQSSIAHDQSVHAPDQLGYMGDRSDYPDERNRWHDYHDNIVTYRGQKF